MSEHGTNSERGSNRSLVLGIAVLALLLMFGVFGLVALRTFSAQRAVAEAQSAREKAANLAKEAALAAAEADEGARREIEAEQARGGGSDAAATLAKSIDELLSRGGKELDAGKPEAGRALIDAACGVLEREHQVIGPMRASALFAEAGRLYEQLGDKPAAGERYLRAVALLEPQVGEQFPEVRRLRAAIERVK